MHQLTVNHFRANLKKSIDAALSNHQPLKVTRRNGGDFIVISAEDWERERETLYVLQNSALMNQIVESRKTHDAGTGRRPSQEEVNEINRV